jgi:hypothetical protein
MENRSFWQGLGWVTLAVSALLGVLTVLLPGSPELRPLSIATVTLFVIICTILYFTGRKAAQSRNKNAFNGLITISVFGKMLLSVGFLLAYQKSVQPADHWYVGVFLLVYTVYTGFEVWFMQKLAHL